MSVIFDYASPGRSNSLGRVYFDVEGIDPEVTPRQALYDPTSHKAATST